MDGFGAVRRVHQDANGRVAKSLSIVSLAVVIYVVHVLACCAEFVNGNSLRSAPVTLVTIEVGAGADWLSVVPIKMGTVWGSKKRVHVLYTTVAVVAPRNRETEG